MVVVVFSCSVRTHAIKFLESVVITLTKGPQVCLAFMNVLSLMYSLLFWHVLFVLYRYCLLVQAILCLEHSAPQQFVSLACINIDTLSCWNVDYFYIIW